MVGTLQEIMCRYMDEKNESLKGCLVAALESKEQYLCLLVESLGTPVASEEIRLSELLTSAGLFRMEEKFNRDGRNRYKQFYLTEEGRQVAEQIKREGYDGEIPQSVPAV
jgi:hypothetical protein